MIKSYADFYHVTAKMRDAQKIYDRTRASSDHAVSKRLEAEIDAAIERHSAKEKPVQAEIVYEKPYTKSPGLPVLSALKGVSNNEPRLS